MCIYVYLKQFIIFSGAKRHMLSTDGLHLSFEGTQALASSVENSVHSLSTLRSAIPTIPNEQPLQRTVGPRRYSGHIDKNLICEKRPIKPLAGQIIIIDTLNMTNKLDRRIDDYQWVNDGVKKLPKKSPIVCKVRHRVKVSDGEIITASSDFVRTEWNLIDSDRFYLFHYTGDESVFKPIKHGNAKKGNKKVFTRTCPSVLDEMKSQIENETVPSKIYNDMKITVDGVAAASGAPRNLKQVQNQKLLKDHKKRLSQDDIYNTLELAYQLDGFIHQIDLYPSLTIVFGLKQSIEDFNNLLTLTSEHKIFLSIDTTFECGNFYLTPVVYKHFLFNSEPTIPLAFLLHEKKDQKFHERFLNVLKEHCPNLSTTEVNFVADREVALTKAVQNVLKKHQYFTVGTMLRETFVNGLDNAGLQQQIQTYISII